MNKNNEQENNLPRGTSHETILAHENSLILEASFQGVSEWRWFAAQAMPYNTSQSLVCVHAVIVCSTMTGINRVIQVYTCSNYNVAAKNKYLQNSYISPYKNT
jgi:hypothetical protein